MRRFIGDVHGHIDGYLNIIKDCEHPSVQVGDMGIGFNEWISFPELPPQDPKHRFIRGNHDNPKFCAEHPNWIKDGTFEEETGTMYIGGAFSIDKEYRTPGKDWWEDEELSYSRLYELTDKYLRLKPEIMVTHDVPDTMIPVLFPNALPIKSRTQVAFGSMLANHKPRVWIFGHWHQSFHFSNPDFIQTDFICLGELAYADIEV